ncbi:hypothetical protein [Erythrobacter oryzae]|uniref:hypothetical protein n=1 Tax=Erythrobacter oryzae TaxID=3019556 RepID=UPI0025546C49|nr:hypothetical protein [Erythrobacter sp. COR-2]
MGSGYGKSIGLRLAAACALALLLTGCGGGDSSGAPPATGGTPTPAPTATPPAVVGGERQIGQWRELILNNDGTINRSEYVRVANNYNTPAIMDYRLGPTAADFGNATNTAAQLWGPDLTSGQGLWPYGTQPANNPGEPNKCLPPSQQPRSDQEEISRGLQGAGWLVGGQHLFLPDNPGDANYRFGISNTRGADGAVFNTGGLCMRMIASWNPDWWNRNNIATPANPQVRSLAASRSDLPLVPVAIARGRANASQISFAAFRDGTIAPIVVGNSAPEFFDASALRLPAGMVPTAMAVTPYNEFLVVAVWDTNTITGKLAFIALRPRQMAVGNPQQTPNTRWYWGTPGAWTNRGMKLLGFVDLPFAAPTSLDVSNNLYLQNPRGFGDNDDPAAGDLSRQSVRDLWRGVNPVYPAGDVQWHQLASGGYAVVASRAEGKVSFVDMTPLYQHYRDLYLTTQANFNRTLDVSLTDGAKFPFSFTAVPGQRPVVTTTLSMAQPTGVSAGVMAKGYINTRSEDYFEYVRRSPREAWSGVEPERYLARSRAFVASMDGTVRGFNVQGLVFPTSPVGKTVSATPLFSFAAGRNPNFAYVNATATASDDLWLVSRGDRRITFAWPTGDVQYSFTDSRLVDPVAGSVSYNQAGFGGNGAGRAVNAPFISVMDFNGKAILTYAVNPRPARPNGELYPFRAPSGPVDALFGSRAPFPGKPFMMDQEEII